MNYPLISEYIEAIKAAEDNFEELTNLRPVLTDDGQPVMTSGNFAVVFKMKDIESGKFYALKCFTKDQEGREEAYHQIVEELKNAESPYLISIQYLDKELFVDTDQTTQTEFPVLLMDWVEGKTLDKYLRENLDDKYECEMLAYNFCQLSQWLISQPFAHGDLKPDNILVRFDGSLVLVDYDGMYVPAMNGQKSREFGSPDFRSPLRTEYEFDNYIDDFPLLSILLSLTAISRYPSLLKEYGAKDRLLFSERDYVEIDNSPVINKLFMHYDDIIHHLACVFISLCKYNFSFTIPSLKKPYKGGEINNYSIAAINILSRPSAKKPCSLSIEELIEGLVELDDLMEANNIDYVLSGSLGLYIHGMVPSSYLPHDIDIIFSNNNNFPELTNQMILDLFVQYCGGERPIYSNSEYSDLFLFYIGNKNIKVDAFIDKNGVFLNSNYCIININGREIKVHNSLSILQEKYKMHRLKDYKFNRELQTSLNQFLSSEDLPEFDYEEFYHRHLVCDIIKDFFIKISKPSLFYFPVETTVLAVLFDKNIKRRWLPPNKRNDCFVIVTSSDDEIKKQDTVIFGIKREFSKVIQLDTNKLFKDWHNHDLSYIVDILYYILSEMKIEDRFVEYVDKLVKIINDKQEPKNCNEELLF